MEPLHGTFHGNPCVITRRIGTLGTAMKQVIITGKLTLLI